MANTKCILGLIAGIASGAIAIVLAASASNAAATLVKRASQPDALTDALKDSFSGWLDRVKKGELEHQ
jgi:hypothetical protein